MAVLEDRILNGVEGIVTATVKGNVKELPITVKVDAKVEKQVTEYKALGHRATQTKPNGWKGTGTLTIRYGSDIFRQLMLEYITTGTNTLIDIIVTNNDPSFAAGTIKTRLGGVNITSATMAMLDVDTEILNEDIPFTFTEVEDL